MWHPAAGADPGAEAPLPPHHVHGEPHDRQDPVERLQDRMEQVLQRFDLIWDHADRLIGAAERFFPRGRGEEG